LVGVTKPGSPWGHNCGVRMEVFRSKRPQSNGGYTRHKGSKCKKKKDDP